MATPPFTDGIFRKILPDLHWPRTRRRMLALTQALTQAMTETGLDGRRLWRRPAPTNPEGRHFVIRREGKRIGRFFRSSGEDRKNLPILLPSRRMTKCTFWPKKWKKFKWRQHKLSMTHMAYMQMLVGSTKKWPKNLIALPIFDMTGTPFVKMADFFFQIKGRAAERSWAALL